MQVARPRSSLWGLGVCRRANEVYLPRASEADRASASPDRLADQPWLSHSRSTRRFL